jgi:tetratricopeptide (TPR) repeat protein
VEGNIYKELGRIEEAIASYEKCAEINPEYEYGYIGEGILYYNQAIDIQEKASNEMDDAKYMVLAEQFEKSLKDCIVPFEKAFNMTKDASLKVSLAEYLKNACYRFASEDESYKAAYDKYAKIVADGKVQ